MSDEPRQPWDRRENESARAYAAFRAFRDLGSARRLADVVDFPHRQVQTWSRRHGWVDRAELEQRTVEVRGLRAEKARLTTRLERATSLEALGREARCLGYVKPGERLFVVKGIPAWRKARGSNRDSRP